MKTVSIPGPAGPLEARWTPAGPPRWAVLCHPHSLYGGTMDDAVLDVVDGALAAKGFARLRFNFRGVGASAGRFDDGRGEAEDLVAVCAWLAAERVPAALWVAGYSFGAAVAWRARSRLASLERLVLVAPPTAMLNLGRSAPATPVSVLAGDADPHCDLAALESAAAAIDVHPIAGADHFFAGRQDALAAALASLPPAA